MFSLAATTAWMLSSGPLMFALVFVASSVAWSAALWVATNRIIPPPLMVVSDSADDAPG